MNWTPEARYWLHFGRLIWTLNLSPTGYADRRKDDMATARVKLVRNALPTVSPTTWALLNDEPLPENFNKWERLDGISRARWEQHRDEVLANWIATKPGRRPSLWWQFDAPRLPESEHGDFAGAHFAKDLIQPRERVGGVGTPLHEVSALMPCYALGLPDSGWDDDVSSDDPPRYESQASYLKRLKLFAPGEARRVRKSQYAPETINWRPLDDDK